MSGVQAGMLYGVGTGPGDPELMTLKAVRALARADVVAHFAKRGAPSNARAIASAHIRDDVIELPLLYPVTTELPHRSDAYQQAITAFYEQSASAVAAHLDAGRTVCVLSEGDPLFYGSYMHLHVRLAPHYPSEVIAGVTAMSGCWSQSGLPLAQGEDVLTVLPGTVDDAGLMRRLNSADAVVIMKVGRNLPRIRRALAATGRLAEAIYVERGTTQRASHMRLADKPDDVAPYLSLVLVPAWRARPGAGPRPATGADARAEADVTEAAHG